MLHNLFIVNSENGIPLGTIKLSEEGIAEKEADLISTSIKAIGDFFTTLEFGNIETFQFFKKQIIVHKKSLIILILVCEKEMDLTKYHPKLELIGMMFDKALEWFKWDSNVTKYDELMETSKKMLLED